MEPITDARGFEAALQTILTELSGMDADDRDNAQMWDAEPFQRARVTTFEDAALLTRDRGLVVRLANGSAFQITIIKSANARSVDDD